MARVRLAPEARQDFDDILDYLRRMAGPRIADRYADLIVAAVERLSEFSGIGTPRPELGAETRLLVIHPYLLIYDGDQASEEVNVLRILHGSRNITEELIRRGSGR